MAARFETYIITDRSAPDKRHRQLKMHFTVNGDLAYVEVDDGQSGRVEISGAAFAESIDVLTTVAKETAVRNRAKAEAEAAEAEKRLKEAQERAAANGKMLHILKARDGLNTSCIVCGRTRTLVRDLVSHYLAQPEVPMELEECSVTPAQLEAATQTLPEGTDDIAGAVRRYLANQSVDSEFQDPTSVDLKSSGFCNLNDIPTEPEQK